MDARAAEVFEESFVRTLVAKVEISYSVIECNKILDPRQAILAIYAQATGRLNIVCSGTWYALYGESLHEYCRFHDIELRLLPLVVSETYKTLGAVEEIIQWLNDNQYLRRQEPLIAIGGGVLLDIAGFACSIYRRSIPYIRIPTTLLGLIDAGIGIKTGVNHHGFKSRIGSYYPPLAVYLDPTFLLTLPKRQISCGLAEMIKLGIVADSELFTWLEHHHAQFFQSDIPAILYGIRRSVDKMLTELEPNLWENDLNRRVDFGHIFSPTFEMQIAPILLHGEAVALDMAFSCMLAWQRSLITMSERNCIFALLQATDLPVFDARINPDILYSALQSTMIHHDGQQRVPLPHHIGSVCFVGDLGYEEICTVYASLKDFVERK